MLKKFIYILALILVPIFGFVSCRPDKRAQDVYSAPDPVLKRAGGEVTLADWTTTPTRDLDLQDQIDFGSVAPLRVQIKSDCSVGGKSVQQFSEFTNRRELRVLEVLPQSVFGRALAKENTLCTFALSPFNTEGSNRVSFIGQIHLVDKRELPVQIERVGPPPYYTTRNYVPPDFANLRVRLTATQNGRAHLACSDFTTPELPFNFAFDFSLLDFAEAEKHDAHQLCRVVIDDGERGRQIGPLMDITFSEKTGEFALNENFLTGDQPSAASKTAATSLAGGHPALLQKWTFTNRSRTVHRLRISAPLVEPVMYFSGFATISIKAGPRAWLSWTSSKQTDILVKPRAQTEVDLMAQTHGPLTCGVLEYIKLITAGPSVATEFNDDGEKIGEFTLAMPQTFYLYQSKWELPVPRLESPLSGCIWN